MAGRVYDTKAWKVVRLHVLERDDWICQIGGKSCTIDADCVDHIQPTSAGGEHYDEANLRAACTACNSSRVHRDAVGYRSSREW